MALPQREKLMEAQFQAFKELGGEAHISEIDRKVTSILDLSEKDSHEIHEGNRTKLAYELAWGRFYLKQVNLLEKLSRGRWSLTAEGFETDKIDTYSIVNNYRPKDSVETELANDLNDDILREETNTEVEKEVQEISIDIKDPFDPKLIDIKSKTMMLKALFERLNHGEIDLFTDFQRQGDLWDITKQSRLIESILIRFPLPAFYFDGSVDDKWLIVDGLQRVSALKNFVIDKNFKGQPFKLANLEFLKNVEGLSYDDLPRDLKRRIDETEITTYIISPGTPIQVKYNLFKRINTSGLFLEPQEIRHALNQGEPAKFVKDLADLPEFKKATCYAIKTERMLDRDFVTRYVSFRLINYNEYEPDLDSFLNKGMSLISTISPVQRNQIKVDFIKAMNACIRLFDKYAFRKRYHIEDTRKPINKALFETWSVTLSKLSEERINSLINDSDSVNLQFIQLMNSDYAFQNSISTSTSDKSRVIKRFSEIQNLVDNLC
ncbi:DUF262 domain-containing protein [Lacibacter luteus]|uniref:DUF262 domain-containing protein n=1 Tax=Lacibacter luteus TaxID=2508719 RepID=A0A4Q1CJU6_9BACT|nr:DUF262 domain-containing protein [Lacibacter luteus]RXK60658.1 DUF262 domain-containing protein [Lacibacter luteus]